MNALCADSAWVSWGAALASLGRYDEAAEKLERALEVNPESTSARNNLKTQNGAKNGARHSIKV